MSALIYFIMAGFATLWTIIACGENIPQKVMVTKIYQQDCTLIPEDKKDLVAKLVVDCVNNATSKNTGENQDADDWVNACHDRISKIYIVDGWEMVSGQWGNGDFVHHSTCKEFPVDTLTTSK